VHGSHGDWREDERNGDGRNWRDGSDGDGCNGSHGDWRNGSDGDGCTGSHSK
jgi:hypothetical protein